MAFNFKFKLKLFVLEIQKSIKLYFDVLTVAKNNSYFKNLNSKFWITLLTSSTIEYVCRSGFTSLCFAAVLQSMKE